MTETPLTVKTWAEIVSGRTGDDAAAIVLARLQQAPWLANIGHKTDRDDEVVRVFGWQEAFAMFTPGLDARTLLAIAPGSGVTGPRAGTNTNGTLNAPFWLLLDRIDRDSVLYRRTADAANHALGVLGDRHYAAAKRASVNIPEDTWPSAAELEEIGAPLYAMQTLGDYLHEYIRVLFIEIYAGDSGESRCSYFRDQLGWFLSGLLPCGWDGPWPQGRLRVL